MLLREGIDENLRFLILEVGKQLEKTRQFLDDPSPNLLEAVLARDDYIDNLKSIIQRSCFAIAAEKSADNGSALDLLKAVDVITANLERIGDFCENIIDQVGYLQNDEVLRGRDFSRFFDVVMDGVAKVEYAALKLDLQDAVAICRAEQELDTLYAQAFRDILIELQHSTNSQGLVTVLFISHYFERMGDALLNIGEAVLSACLGERIKIDQFWALEDSLEGANLDRGITDVSLEAMGETKSGCRIDRVSSKSGADGVGWVIFKEGRKQKLLDETTSIDAWREIVPGLAPKVYTFYDHGETAAILFEYLPGRTFEELLLRGGPGELDAALAAICETLETVWRKTRSDGPVSARFVSQLRGRLEDVYAVHPDFRGSDGAFGNLRLPSFDELLNRAARLEEALTAPFSVFIHGDFNVDNIIYDGKDGRVHFIDLHRSRMMDYVQDVSVFLVSNQRLQVFTSPIRRRIGHVAVRFHAFAQRFAGEMGDATFEARLALGLARSYATSARFVLDEDLAKTLFLRARYLIERLVLHDPEHIADFQVPREVLVG
jgi:phosphate uptake regulator/aminoglycoside phosphotransferase